MAMFGLGIVLIILSTMLSVWMESPIPSSLAVLAALVSLFFEGYRGLFAGYVATIGVVFLVLIVVCGVANLTSH